MSEGTLYEGSGPTVDYALNEAHGKAVKGLEKPRATKVHDIRMVEKGGMFSMREVVVRVQRA